MKRIKLFIAIALITTTNMAFALDIQPYSAATLAAMQKADRPVALHFHADWCPVCREQAKVFKTWEGKTSVPGTLLIVDYDNERALRSKLGVRTQSTVIVYHGSVEKARIGGETEPGKLRAVLLTGQGK